MQSDKSTSKEQQTTVSAKKQAASKKAATKPATTKTAPPKAAKKAAPKKEATKKEVTKKATKSAVKTAPKKAATKSTKTATKAAAPAKKAASSKASPSAQPLHIRFEIYFSTQFGESLQILGAHPLLGADNLELAPALTYVDQHKWAIDLTFSNSIIDGGPFTYSYVLTDQNGEKTYSAPYQLQLPKQVSFIHIKDAWNAESFYENAFGTDAFRALLNPVATKAAASKQKGTHRFIVTAPALPKGQSICLIGDAQELGAWEADKAIELAPTEGGRWQTELTLTNLEAPIDYKFGIYNQSTGALESFEAGENRTLEAGTQKADLYIIQNGFIRTN